MMRWLKLLVGSAALCGLVLMSGCGTLRATVHTIVHRDLSISREVKMMATGMFANFLADGDAANNAFMPSDERIAQVKRGWENGQYHLTATMEAVPRKDWMAASDNETVHRNYYWILTYYEYTAVREGQKEAGARRAHPGEQLGREMAASMFSLTERVTIPGEVLSTNGTVEDNGTIQWNIDVAQVNDGYSLYAKSRTVNLIECFVTLVLLLVAAGLIGTTGRR